MPTELQVIRANEFVSLDPHDHLNFETSKKALRVLAVACRLRNIHRAILDLRMLPIPAHRLFAPSELAALVDTFREAGFTKEQRLAVLYRRDPHGGARLFAFIGIMRGWQVRAFGDFEEAFFWLSEEDKKNKKKRTPLAGKTVPIHFKKPKRTRAARSRTIPFFSATT